MAPPEGESLMSMKEINAALLKMMDSQAGAGFRVDPEYRGMLHMVDKKSKLELLAMTDEFEERLKKASPKQVQEMVDNGMFKIICTQLGGFRGLDTGDTGIALCADKISLFLDALPELCDKAWTYGAVRPIAEVVSRQRNLKDPEILQDETLRAALNFLVSMGKPWQDHIVNPGSQKEAKKATGKLYRWMLKEGIIDAVVRLFCALPEFTKEDREKSYYSKIGYSCATVLWFATLVQLERPQLASKTELLKPIFYFLLGEPDVFSGIKTVSLSLMLHLWFLNEPDERPETADARTAIAHHKDVWKLVELLKESVDNPEGALQTIRPHVIVQSAYACLLRFLISTPQHRSPPTPFLETTCHLLGAAVIAPVWDETKFLVVALFHSGAVSDDFLMTHAFPCFLSLFAAEVARRGAATSPPPNPKLLLRMTMFLVHAFGHKIAEVAKEQGRPPDPDLLTGGTSLNPQTLPWLGELVVSTGAAKALAALGASPLYGLANMVSAAVAESLQDNRAVYDELLDQMVPQLVLAIHDGGEQDWVRRIELATVLRLITRRLRPGCPELHFAGIPPALDKDFARKRCVKYHHGSNIVRMGLDVIAGKEDLIARLFKALDAETPEAQLARVAEMEGAARGAGTVSSKCSVCGSEVEVLKRCARCHGAEYCSAACQKKDWPEHKKVCKEPGTKMERDAKKEKGAKKRK